MDTISRSPVQSGRPSQKFIARLFDVAHTHPVLTAILIVGADLAVLTGVRLLLQTLAPAWPTDFVALFPTTLLLLCAAAVLRLWRTIGVNPPAQWRNLVLLLLPAVVIIVPPLMGGLKPMAGSQLAFLVVGYALTGLREEILHRGVILRVLRPLSQRRSVLISSALFGVMHLSNLMVRSNPAIVAAQAVGAFCFGVGFAALKLRTNTVVPLIVLHAVHDLLLQVTQLPLIALDVAEVTILLIYGLLLIWRKPIPSTVETP